jgi:hypothetical protein
MKFNKWTVGLAAVGVVSLASAARADEQMSQVQTALSQTTLSGYVDTAAEWNPGSDSNAHSGLPAHIPAYSFAKNDGFSLNAIDIALDKPEDSSAWAAGYHVELMDGPDSVGVALGSASAVVRQAFIRLHTPVGGNGIDWQIGVFDSIIGYESNSDPLNPNYTRSYGYTIEPTTFTGILGTYKVNDEISFSGGIANSAAYVNGFTTSDPVESQKTYMGSISLTAPDSMGFLKGATWSGGVVNSVNPPAANTTTSLYTGATVPTPISQLKVGGSFDYEFEQAGSADGDDIWDVAGYATIQATSNLSFNLRAEYLSDDTRGAFDAVSLYSAANGGHGNRAEEITATIQYNLWANVMSRAEFRWDHVEHGDVFGANGSTTTDNGAPDKNNDFLLALNLIYQF